MKNVLAILIYKKIILFFVFQKGEEPFARFARDAGGDDDDDDEEEENEEPLSDSIKNDEPEPEGKTKTRNPKITTTLQSTILLLHFSSLLDY